MALETEMATTAVKQSDRRPPPVGDNVIETEELKQTFGGGQAILDGVNLVFPKGSITTVMGPSGTGKSVLLKHILALLYPEAGDIRVFGKSLMGMPAKELYRLRENFGVLFQDGALFGSMNIYDNTAFPLRKHTKKSEEEIRDIVMRRLTEVGLEHSPHKMPNEISGGMRKRAGFARALVLNPAIVLFDEPDSGLDPVRTSLLGELILDIHEDHQGTYILVTHNMPLAELVSDYVAVIWKGKIIHWGPTEESFASPDPFIRQFLHGAPRGPLGMD